MSLDAAAIEALKAQYPGVELRRVGTGDDLFVVRAPKQGDFNRFMDKIAIEKGRPAALREIGLTSVVYPDRAAFEAMLERKPGLVIRAANVALELGGLGAEEEAEKL